MCTPHFHLWEPQINVNWAGPDMWLQCYWNQSCSYWIKVFRFYYYYSLYILCPCSSYLCAVSINIKITVPQYVLSHIISTSCSCALRHLLVIVEKGFHFNTVYLAQVCKYITQGCPTSPCCHCSDFLNEHKIKLIDFLIKPCNLFW